MGSFINQCMASRQTINEGSPIRVIPLIQQRSFHPTICTVFGSPELPPQQVYGPDWGSGPALRWKPVMGFFEGTAEDRSGIELNLNDHTRVQLAHLFSQMVRRCAVGHAPDRPDDIFNFDALCRQYAPRFYEASKTKPWYAEAAIISDEETRALWESLDEEESFRRSKVFIADNFNAFRPLMLGVIHEDAYQWLLKEGQKTTRWDGYHRQTYIDKLASEAVQLAKEIAEMHKNEDKDRCDAGVALHATEPLREGLRRISDDAYGSAAYWTRELHGLVVRHLAEGPPLGALVRQHLSSYLDDSYVLRGLRIVNVPLEPMLYAGQDYDNESGKRYASLVGAMRNSMAARRQRAYED